jgi:engulfment/cell motility protein 1
LDDLKDTSTFIHVQDDITTDTEPVDLSIVSSVVSNVYNDPPASSEGTTADKTITNGDSASVDKAGVAKHKKKTSRSSTSTKITIHGIVPGSSSAQGSKSQNNNNRETALLQLHPQTHTLASEWLDGLLMLLNQKPITAETTKLVKLIGSYGLKIRLLNIRYEDLSSDEHGHTPGREGLDEEYWYDFGGMMEAQPVA